jgi:hypothetical protein
MNCCCYNQIIKKKRSKSIQSKLKSHFSLFLKVFSFLLFMLLNNNNNNKTSTSEN